VSTGIYKEPVGGRIMLRRHNLDGDQQADLTVHGGWDKAVYVYPSEHYPLWQAELPAMRLPYGIFGENFTTGGLDESSVHIGDQFRIGGAIVEVTQPRMPCYKLGIRFKRPDMPKRFHASGRCGGNASHGTTRRCRSSTAIATCFRECLCAYGHAENQMSRFFPPPRPPPSRHLFVIMKPHEA
jgi:hypothetical protein